MHKYGTNKKIEEMLAHQNKKGEHDTENVKLCAKSIISSILIASHR